MSVRYATEIADALDKAHRKGITHRDLKPGNIMIGVGPTDPILKAGHAERLCHQVERGHGGSRPTTDLGGRL